MYYIMLGYKSYNSQNIQGNNNKIMYTNVVNNNNIHIKNVIVNNF